MEAVYGAPGEPLAAPSELKLLSEGLRALHRERLDAMEAEEEDPAAALEMKMRLLQDYVIDLSDQNDFLIQTLEELQNRTVLKMTTAVDAEFQRPTLAQRPMPAERLSRSTATQTASPWPGQRVMRRPLGAPEEPLSFEARLPQREEAVCCQQEKDAELEQQAAQIQGLQSQLLLGQGDRDGLAHELDAQEQRDCELQARQREMQAELEQRCSRVLQLERELESSKQQEEGSRQQWVEKLTPSGKDRRRRSPVLGVEAAPRKGEEEQAGPGGSQLAWAQEEMEALWAELQDTRLLAEGATAQLAAAETEVGALSCKYRLALSEAAEQNEALHRLQETQRILQQRLAVRESQAQEQRGSLRGACEQIQQQKQQVAQLARADAQAAEEQVQQRGQATIQQQEDLAMSRASQEAAESGARTKEAEIRTSQREERFAHHQLTMLRSEVDRQRQLLSTEQHESHVLRGELQRRGQELSTLQEACQREVHRQALRTEEQLVSLLQLQPSPPRKQAEVRAVQDELFQCQEQLGEAHTQHQQLAWDVAAVREQHEAALQERAGKEAEASSLRGMRRHHLQDELRSLRDARGQQGKTMVEQTHIIRQLQHEKEASLRQSQATAALLEQLQGERGSRQQADMEQLQEKLRQLQQELDVCKGHNQDHLSKLQARDCTVEKPGLDLLLQQCQLLQDQLAYYEEVTQKQELELSHHHEREQRLQEQLGQAEKSASTLESSLDLYKKKYQASLGQAGQLQGQLRGLQEELAGQAKEREEALRQLHTEQRVLQEELVGKCRQASRAEGAVEQLTRELQEAQEELSQGRQLTCRCEEALRELQEQLAASHLKLLDQEAALATARREMASYKATHSYTNGSYGSQIAGTETLRQELLQVEEESSQRQQQAAEYQGLVQDLKLELARVAEQKKSSLKDAARLERSEQRLRQEAAAERERHQLEATALEQRAQQLQLELHQSRRLCGQQEQAVQKRDELLRKSQAEMVRARSALQEKGKEAERQRAQAHHLEAGLQQAQQELQHLRAECGALRAQGQQQQQQAAKVLAQQEAQVRLSQSSLRTAQEQLAERAAEVMRHVEAGRRVEAELRRLHERLSGAAAELEQKRELLEKLAEELSHARQQYQRAQQEAQQHRQEAAQLALALDSSQEGLSSLQQRVQEHESALEGLRAELSQQEQRAEDLRGQLHRATERETCLAQEHRDLQRQLQSSKGRLQEEERRWQGLQACMAEREVENRALREELKAQATELLGARGDLEGAQLQLQQQTAEVLRQEATLSQLHTELHAAQERERQRSHALAAAKSHAQELQGQAACCQASQRELVEQVCTAQEQVAELGSQAQRWQEEHRASVLALAEKDKELVVMKVELASLEQKCHSATEEREGLQHEANHLRQKFVVSSQEVEALQTSLEMARSDSRRLHHESELVVANVSQWVTEQKQVNEKLGHKIRDQIKHIAQLTGERDHLHGLMERLQQENKWLKAEVDERRIACERLKALHSSDPDPCAVLRQPWPTLLPAGASPCSGWRRSEALTTTWNLP